MIKDYRSEIQGWRKAFKRKGKEVKTLANACKNHKKHIAELEKENERLREALREVFRETLFADVVTVRMRDVHEIARKGLVGDNQ